LFASRGPWRAMYTGAGAGPIAKGHRRVGAYDLSPSVSGEFPGVSARAGPGGSGLLVGVACVGLPGGGEQGSAHWEVRSPELGGGEGRVYVRVIDRQVNVHSRRETDAVCSVHLLPVSGLSIKGNTGVGFPRDEGLPQVELQGQDEGTVRRYLLGARGVVHHTGKPLAGGARANVRFQRVLTPRLELHEPHSDPNDPHPAITVRSLRAEV